MPTTKRETAAPATAAAKQDSVVIGIESIVLEGLTSERNFEPRKNDDGVNASMGLRVQDPEEFQRFRTTVCSVELRDADETAIVTLESKFRIEFDLQGPLETEGLGDDLSALALRVTYPYHRQLISSIVAQSGLPGVTLPLIPNAELDKVAGQSADE